MCICACTHTGTRCSLYLIIHGIRATLRQYPAKANCKLKKIKKCRRYPRLQSHAERDPAWLFLHGGYEQKRGGKGKTTVCQCVCQKRDGWVQTVWIWMMNKWYVEMTDTNRNVSASSVGGRASSCSAVQQLLNFHVNSCWQNNHPLHTKSTQKLPGSQIHYIVLIFYMFSYQDFSNPDSNSINLKDCDGSTCNLSLWKMLLL